MHQLLVLKSAGLLQINEHPLHSSRCQTLHLNENVVFEKYTCSLFLRDFDKEINISLMSVW